MPHPIFEAAAGRPAPLLGTMVTYDVMDGLELHNQLGPDFVIIDCQHSLITEGSVQRLVYASIDPTRALMVRVSANDPERIGCVIDAGADAIIVPMINTADQARAAVAACRYGPAGVRSFGPYRKTLPKSPKALEERVSCFVMIETVEAMNNLDDICAVDGVAGVYMGSTDLAITMGEPIFVSPSLSSIRDAGRKIVAACQAAGIIAGAHAGPLWRTKELIDDGFKLLTIGIDFVYVRAGINADVEAIGQYLAAR